MKKINLFSLILFVFLGALCATASAADKKAGDHDKRIIPVLVEVNAHGEVTKAEPGVDLRPDLKRAMQQTVRQMITKPAMSKGHPVSSQMVLNLQMKTVERKDGKYDLQFAYVSSKPIPSGDWYWVHRDHQLKLASRSSSDYSVPSYVEQPPQDTRTYVNNGH